MKRGDHLRVQRMVGPVPSYFHHGIYHGRNRVVHYSGELAQKSNAAIEFGSISKFIEDGKVEIVSYPKSLSVKETIFRAESCLGENNYSFIANNCEHFAVWCKTGRLESYQVDTSKKVGRLIAPILVSLASIYTDLKACAAVVARHKILRVKLRRMTKNVEKEERRKTEEKERKVKSELAQMKIDLSLGIKKLSTQLKEKHEQSDKFWDEKRRTNQQINELFTILTAGLKDASKSGDDLIFVDYTFLIRRLRQLLEM